jgi:hypothetical protein
MPVIPRYECVQEVCAAVGWSKAASRPMLAGMTQDLASPAMPAGPVAWPAGYTAAACLTFDLDAEAAVLTADISSVYRMSPMSHQAYGPLVGIPRILPSNFASNDPCTNQTRDNSEKGDRHGGDRA